jgi:hypothetical protein
LARIQDNKVAHCSFIQVSMALPLQTRRSIRYRKRRSWHRLPYLQAVLAVHMQIPLRIGKEGIPAFTGAKIVGPGLKLGFGNRRKATDHHPAYRVLVATLVEGAFHFR